MQFSDDKIQAKSSKLHMQHFTRLLKVLLAARLYFLKPWIVIAKELRGKSIIKPCVKVLRHNESRSDVTSVMLKRRPCRLQNADCRPCRLCRLSVIFLLVP